MEEREGEQQYNEEEKKFLEWNGPQVSVELARQQREEEIKENFDERFPPKARGDFFNNFTMHLPCEGDNLPGTGNYRQVARKIGIWDKPYGEFVESTNNPRTKALTSQLRKEQTSEEFYATIDRVLQEEGINPDLIRELQTKRVREQIYDLCESVFDRLRTLYSYEDLVG